MPLHAELHRHLAGAVVPRILWRYLHRSGHNLASAFPEYEQFEHWLTQPRESLAAYLELHTLVEELQSLENLPYFISKLVRGAHVFEGILYMELRYTPYYRTDPQRASGERVAMMREVVRVIGAACQSNDYPIVVRQILCMHSRLPPEVNRAIVDLASQEPEWVCGIDLAGPDSLYRDQIESHLENFRAAKSYGLNTTCHLFETADGFYPEFLPLLSRIGHGLQLALHRPDLLQQAAARGQCLEICPTSYLKTRTLADLTPLREVFSRCDKVGLDVAICTDNPGLHNVRLPFEYENLLTLDVIDFQQLRRCQTAAFRHAFAWPHPNPPDDLLRELAGQPLRPRSPLSAGHPAGTAETD